MINRKIAIGVSCCFIATGFAVLLFLEKDEIEQTLKVENHHKKPVQSSVKKENPTVQENKKYNFYSETPYNLPLSGINEINKAAPSMQKSADEILEKAQGVYFVKYDKENNLLKLLPENSISAGNKYQRHGLEYVFIHPDGTVKFSEIGYEGEDGEISNAVEAGKDIWEFDETIEPPRPLKHIAYGDDNKVKFTEIWNYDESNPIKYEMKNSHEKVISILKETVSNDSNYKKEHIFYDDEGKIKFSLSANYDGVNLSRLTLYDADNKYGISIISEYSDGNKVKEVIYNQNYELQNTINSEYEEGKRRSLTVLDADSKETEKYSN